MLTVYSFCHSACDLIPSSISTNYVEIVFSSVLSISPFLFAAGHKDGEKKYHMGTYHTLHEISFVASGLQTNNECFQHAVLDC